jgi:pre-mRNA branch site protein p14
MRRRWLLARAADVPCKLGTYQRPPVHPATPAAPSIPQVNRILYVRNLPYKITAEEMYDIFGKYGAIRQIRVGAAADTKGTAFVVYEDIFDAKTACEHLSGFNVGGRYLVVLYYQPTRGRTDATKLASEVEVLRAKVAEGAAAAGEGGGDDDAGVSVDDEADKRLMGRR